MRKKKNFQHDKYDTKTRWTIFEIKWIQIVFQVTFDDFVDYFKIINEYKIISNFIFDLSFDILKMIYHLILKKKYEILFFRLEHRQRSIAYVIDSNMNDIDLDEMINNEIRKYEIFCTNVNLNEMIHKIYNIKNMKFCMTSKIIYNSIFCYFFNMNFFRCLNFENLKNFLYHVKHVHMIQKIQIAWKHDETFITKKIRCLQNRVKKLIELNSMIEKKKKKIFLIKLKCL